METRKPRVVAQFTENGRVAVVRMQSADNRVNPEFIRDFNNALDEVERLYTALLNCHLTKYANCKFLLQYTYSAGHDYDWTRKVLLKWLGSRKSTAFIQQPSTGLSL